MKYLVSVRVIHCGTVTVEAMNKKDAIERAKEKCYCGGVNWKDSTTEIDSIKTEQDRRWER